MPPEQFWLMLAQTIATAILGIGAISVAAVSAIISYRNNFGWMPGLMVTMLGHGVERETPNHQTISMGFDIWNRRKYPIVVYTVKATFDVLDLGELIPVTITPPVQFGASHDTKWLRFAPMTTLDANKSCEFEVRAFHRALGNGANFGNVEFEVRYYDPRQHKILSFTFKHGLTTF